MSSFCNYIKLGILIVGLVDAATLACMPAQGEASYLVKLQHKIKKAWVFPEKTPKKAAKVRFTINTNGALVSAKVSQSCGSAECDTAALKTIENAAPFDELQKNAPNTVDIEYTFDYLKENKDWQYQNFLRRVQLTQPKVKTKKGAK